MKQFIYAFLLVSFFTFSKCNKDDVPTQLPPETTTGAMTFGCKINGQIFVPRDGNGKSGLNPEYVNLGTGVGGGWFLNIPAYNYNTQRGINIETDSLLLQEGKDYEFKQQKKGFPLTFYQEVQNGSIEIFGKLDTDSGILSIKKHDQINHIISGTFSFTATKIANGAKINVTEGRFDIRY